MIFFSFFFVVGGLCLEMKILCSLIHESVKIRSVITDSCILLL